MAARALVVSLNIDGGICVIWLPGEGTPLATTEFALSPEPIDVDLLFPTEVVGAAPPNILVPACAALEATIRTHMEGLKAAGLFFWKEVSFDVDPSTWEANYVALFQIPATRMEVCGAGSVRGGGADGVAGRHDKRPPHPRPDERTTEWRAPHPARRMAERRCRPPGPTARPRHPQTHRISG